MTKKTTTKQPAYKKVAEVLKKPISFIVASIAILINQGLAFKGASQYLGNMSEDAKTIVAVLFVILLTYVAVQGFNKVFK